jgi:hypothetical protein
MLEVAHAGELDSTLIVLIGDTFSAGVAMRGALEVGLAWARTTPLKWVYTIV